jgi:hypothetical protein
MFSVDAYFAEKLREEKLEKQREKAAKYCAQQHKFPFFGYDGEDQTLMYRVNDGEWKEFDGQVADLIKNTDNKIDVQIGGHNEDPPIIGNVYNIVESEGMIFIIGEDTCWSNENFLDQYMAFMEEIAIEGLDGPTQEISEQDVQSEVDGNKIEGQEEVEETEEELDYEMA